MQGDRKGGFTVQNTGVGIIGTGRRGYDLGMCIIDLIGKTSLGIRALSNRTRTRMEEAGDAFRARYTGLGKRAEIRLYDSYEDLVRDPDVQLIIIVSPQNVHREHAVSALWSGKKVFLDKPMAHRLDEAIVIRKTELETGNPLFIGFTRRYERAWLHTYGLVQDGVIGDPKMMLIKDVLPYHIYFHDWHRRMEWSGGVIADKISHLFDACNWFAGSEVQRLSAFGGRAVFNPEEDPPNRCSECDRECPYRVVSVHDESRPDMMTDFSDSRQKETTVEKIHDNCVWLPGADINDHGVIQMAYANGIKASIFWSIFGPDSDDQEVFEIVGDRGKIVLTRQIGEILVIGDYGKTKKKIDIKADSFDKSHFGADHQLIRELDSFLKGAPPVVSGKEGLASSRLVEAAHRSIRANGELVLMENVENA
jgi:predicted dehydrogenase